MKESSLMKIGARGERFGRAKKPAAPEILETRRKRMNPIPLETASYYCQMRIHRAHVVMLTEQGILSKDESSAILRGLKEVEKEAENDENLMSYMSTETALIRKIGEVGGKMHIGRSRNDLGATQRRMFYRDQIEHLIGAIIKYRKTLLQKAEEHVNTVMSGYTHWRQAQPITLAHYLMGHVDAAGRGVERFEDVYRRTNLNCLGAAALAGTGWSIDRERTRVLLGFEKLCENTYDCVAAHDYVVELASAIAIHLSNLSRLAQDLEIWSSDEFAMIDLDEAYAGTSSIMPQKKNPRCLEMIKHFAAESIGVLVASISSIKGVSYTNIGDRVMVEPMIVDVAIGNTRIMAGVVSTLVPMKKMMLLKVSKGFSTMTELADTLVRSYGISFRQSHDIIAETVSTALAEGLTADQITPRMIEDAAVKSINQRLTISEEQLRLALDPAENVKRRKIVGGPAPVEVKRMIADRRAQINLEESRRQDRLRKLEKAQNELKRAESETLGS